MAFWRNLMFYLSVCISSPDGDPDYPQFHVPSCTTLQESALGNPWTCHVHTNVLIAFTETDFLTFFFVCLLSFQLVSLHFITFTTVSCSPVNLLSPARFRIVYAFMFGSMSANLLNLIGTGFIRITINVIFLDIIFNTSTY